MEARKVTCSEIISAVKKLFMDCNYFIGDDIYPRLKPQRKTSSRLSAKACSTRL